MSVTLRQIGVAFMAVLVFTVVLGIGYPLLITGVGHIVAAGQANGSLVTDKSGAVIGSTLIGQDFSGAAWFHSRPSAAGTDGYDALSSSGSNLAADNPTLIDQVAKRRAAIVVEDGVRPDQVPADALLASGSGLDPHISPAYAAIQVNRVAKARGLSVARVSELIAAHTEGRDLGFIGQERVNVLELNLALSMGG